MAAVRAIHFAATLTVAGAVFFSVFIAGPAFHETAGEPLSPARIRAILAWIAWTGLGAAVVSGMAWLVLVAQVMSGQTLDEVFSEGILWTVLSRTVFGSAWFARAALACALALIFVPFLSVRRDRPAWMEFSVVVLAAGLAGTLAFAGHAVGGQDGEGVMHPAADFVHLVAAAGWAGGLLPLGVLLTIAGREPASAAITHDAAARFSIFGMICVAALLFTGIVNTRYLAGSVPALTETGYGHLLLVKIALFAVMVAIATVNRLWLTPRLVPAEDPGVARTALRRLRRNVATEIAAAAVILGIVGLLGMTPPGLHQHPEEPEIHHSH